MPLYTFICGREHVTEKLADTSVSRIPCHCGQQAKRQSVYRFATGHRDWGGDFVMPSDVRSAIEESNGYKKEAVAAMNDAVENGWKPRS